MSRAGKELINTLQASVALVNIGAMQHDCCWQADKNNQIKNEQ
jgi:hypothetical protein